MQNGKIEKRKKQQKKSKPKSKITQTQAAWTGWLLIYTSNYIAIDIISDNNSRTIHAHATLNLRATSNAMRVIALGRAMQQVLGSSYAVSQQTSHA